MKLQSLPSCICLFIVFLFKLIAIWYYAKYRMIPHRRATCVAKRNQQKCSFLPNPNVPLRCSTRLVAMLIGSQLDHKMHHIYLCLKVHSQKIHNGIELKNLFVSSKSFFAYMSNLIIMATHCKSPKN